MAKKNQKESKKQYITEEVLDASNEIAVKAESFVEKNAKILGIIFGVLIVGALGYFAYLRMVVEPKTNAGFAEFYQAQKQFQLDSLETALNGTVGGAIGYAGIKEEYGGTKPANLAKYMAGITLYKQGKYKEALENFEDFSTNEPAMLAQKFGMIANALVQTKNEEKALDYYTKAAKATDLEVFQTIYYTRAGKLALHLGKNDTALEYFSELEETYPGVNNGEAAKYIEMIKHLNLK